jgi:outer membrane protein OmpA-like peptidoglycan-associated protein
MAGMLDVVRRGLASIVIVIPLAASGQQVETDKPVQSEELASRLTGFNYQEGPESELELRGTSIALEAEGEAEVEFQEGRARVAVDVEKLPHPGRLGPFATYVVWAVTADGNANNIGSIEVHDGRGELDASTPLSQFALIVTAEPHFAVTAPSRAMVLQNVAKDVKAQSFNITGIKQRIDYSALASQVPDEKREIPHDLVQARYALAIAEGADADRLAPQEFAKAQALLAQAEAAQSGKSASSRKDVPRIARSAVQNAEDARRRAVDALAKEQKAAAAEAARREAESRAAAAAALAAEEAKRSEAQAAEQSALAASETERAAARADLVARLNRVLPTRETDRGIVAEIAGVQFATGKALLNKDAQVALARFAGIVGVYPSMKFRVEGHTDSTGSDELNRRLSYDRAITVRDYLILQGVEASNINVEGLGPSRPVDSNDTAEGRARNRRVEIILTGDPVASG